VLQDTPWEMSLMWSFKCLYLQHTNTYDNTDIFHFVNLKSVCTIFLTIPSCKALRSSKSVAKLLMFYICSSMVLETVLFSESGFLPILYVTLHKSFHVDSSPTQHNIPEELNFYSHQEPKIMHHFLQFLKFLNF